MSLFYWIYSLSSSNKKMKIIFFFHEEVFYKKKKLSSLVNSLFIILQFFASCGCFICFRKYLTKSELCYFYFNLSITIKKVSKINFFHISNYLL